MEHYVFSTIEQGEACITAINESGWFPITGKKQGTPNPSAQKTVIWHGSPPKSMLTGEFAVPRIPEARLDFMGVPQENRDAFIAAFGQDIRDLENDEFVIINEEEA